MHSQSNASSGLDIGDERCMGTTSQPYVEHLSAIRHPSVLILDCDACLMTCQASAWAVAGDCHCRLHLGGISAKRSADPVTGIQ